jgi:hypothetical protein
MAISKARRSDSRWAAGSMMASANAGSFVGIQREMFYRGVTPSLCVPITASDTDRREQWILGRVFEITSVSRVAHGFIPPPKDIEAGCELRGKQDPTSRASRGLKAWRRVQCSGQSGAVSPGRKPGFVMPRLASVISNGGIPGRGTPGVWPALMGTSGGRRLSRTGTTSLAPTIL